MTLEQTHSAKGQIVTVSGFVGHRSLTATELCQFAECLSNVYKTTGLVPSSTQEKKLRYEYNLDHI